MINRNKVGDYDVNFSIKYCGICHTDIHFSAGDLPAMYPMVPGHELAGIVTEVGKKVTKCKVGDRVGVGCMVDSCLQCVYCKEGDEQYCEKGSTYTYNGHKQSKEFAHMAGNLE